jgi:hypothetical protein
VHHLGPGAWQFRRLEIASEHRPFEAIAQDHMSGIGDFVGIDPDQAALHPGLAPIERFRLPFRALAIKRFAQDRRCIRQKRPAAAHLHFE